jgi:hypothetical protein
MTDNKKVFQCVLCAKPVKEYGNNASPIFPADKCCDNCNDTFVIPARLLNTSMGRDKHSPDYRKEWGEFLKELNKEK